MKPVFLTREDVERMTKRKQKAAMRRALERMGIPYTRAADGEPLVRAEVLDVSAARRKTVGPRWDLIAG